MNETRSSEVAHTRALCRVCTPSLFPNLAQLNNSLIALAYLVAKPKAFLCFEDGVAEIFAVESLPARCPERLAWSEKLPVTSYVVRSGTHWQWDLADVSLADRNPNKGGAIDNL
ncbi:MAG: hypothetical protein IPM76_21925 [Chloroflexi bacterium]|nr:hypothetical protein [Chloroflexota bacterium]